MRSKQNPAWLGLPCIKKMYKKERQGEGDVVMDEGGGFGEL